MPLSPVPSEQPDATCANCGAQLVADQRYCLSCGQPVSPVRLAFLDVLSPATPAPPPAGAVPAAWGPPPGTIEVSPANYVAVQGQGGANAWLRRNSGLLGLIAILGLFLLTGLLVGHWVSASKTPANTTIKVEGLGGLATGVSGTGSSSAAEAPASETTGTGTKTSSKQEAKEAAEGTHETAKEKAPPPKPKKATHDKVSKLTHSSGKKHQEEINALGAEPIEVG